MKRLALILFAALCFTTGVSAQTLPTKGSFGTEVQFNPFDQNGQTFKLDGLKFRYFVTDKDVLRLKLGFNLDHSSFKNEYTDEYDEQEYNAALYKYSIGDFKLDAGYERHFNVAKRVSIYVGGSVGFTRHFASTKFEETSNRSHNDFMGEITNGAILPGSGEINVDIENMLPAVNDRAYWGFNAAVFTGLDFYVYKGLYVGTEFGIGFHTNKLSKMTYEGMNENTRYHEFTTDDVTNTQLKTYIEPVLRLGWTF